MVWVVIVHRDRPTVAVAAIEHWIGQGVSAVTLVDNGSAADALHLLREAAAQHPAVDLVALGRNTGFGPGANAGLRRWLAAGVDEACVVVPDDARAAPGTLAALVAASGDRLLGLVCADVGDGVRARIDPFLGPVPGEPVDATGPIEVDYPHGTMLLITRACALDVGLFDERYFAYCEEADLGLRARRRGWGVAMVAGARVENPEVSPGTDAVDYLQLRNTLLLLRTHFGPGHAAVRTVVAIVTVALGSVWLPARGAYFFSPRARLRAIIDFGRRRYGPPPSGLSPRPGPARDARRPG